MTRSSQFAVAGIACLSFALTGCGLDPHQAYSPNLKYGIRQDPIITIKTSELGDERYDPDRPGIFPLMKVEDIQKPDHPYYAKRSKLDEKALRDPARLNANDRKELEDALELLFGTPAKPVVNAKAAECDESATKDLKVDDKMLALGSTRYRIHCLHCHGVAGDGRGPTSRWINPHPRDFRQGMFKFQSVDQTTDSGMPPSRTDLMRTLRQGLEGTAMPTFNLLKDEELESLISYVIHLSLRGQVEYYVLKDFEDEKGALVWNQQDKIPAKAKIFLKVYLEQYWAVSQQPDRAIRPAQYPYDSNDPKALAASVQRGQQIFAAKPSVDFQRYHALKLAKTEKAGKKLVDALAAKRAAAKLADPKIAEEALAKIALTDKEKADQAVVKDELPELEKVAFAAEALTKAELYLKGANCASCHTNFGREARYRFDEWGTLVRPNNLSLGNLRGGKRPVDIYYRVHSGINGSGMAAFGKTFKGHEEYIWDLVNFVSNVPYPSMRKQLGIQLD